MDFDTLYKTIISIVVIGVLISYVCFVFKLRRITNDYQKRMDELIKNKQKELDESKETEELEGQDSCKQNTKEE